MNKTPRVKTPHLKILKSGQSPTHKFSSADKTPHISFLLRTKPHSSNYLLLILHTMRTVSSFLQRNVVLLYQKISSKTLSKL